MADQSRIQSFRTAPGATEAPPNGYRWNGHGNGHGPSPGNGHGAHLDPHHASTGQLITQAANQISTLVRSELALGKAELVEKGRKLGLGGGLLATAGVLSLYAFGLVIAVVVAVLDQDWSLWLAILVPLLALGALMLGLVAVGVRKLRAGASAPTQAADSVRDDIQSVRHAFQEGRHTR